MKQLFEKVTHCILKLMSCFVPWSISIILKLFRTEYVNLKASQNTKSSSFSKCVMIIGIYWFYSREKSYLTLLWEKLVNRETTFHRFSLILRGLYMVHIYIYTHIHICIYIYIYRQVCHVSIAEQTIYAIHPFSSDIFLVWLQIMVYLLKWHKISYMCIVKIAITFTNCLTIICR